MSQPEPGWYRDPAGRSGDARWWDGLGWTEAHIARESTEAIIDPPALPGTASLEVSSVAPTHSFEVAGRPDAGRWDVVTPTSNDDNVLLRRSLGETGPPPATGPTMTLTMPPSAPPIDRTRRSRLRWVYGGLVAVGLVLVLLVTTGVFSPGTGTDDSPDLGALPSAAAPTTDSGVHPIRIIDADAGISYKYLGVGWKEYALAAQPEMRTTVGQYIVTQPKIPTGGEFIAQVTSGLVSDQFGAAEPSQWPALIKQVKTSVQGAYYPQPNTTKDFVDEAFQIDGHAAYRLGFDLSWDVAGYDSTGERAELILIDSGKDRPALVYLSFPNTHAELYPLMDEVIASITVDP